MQKVKKIKVIDLTLLQKVRDLKLKSRLFNSAPDISDDYIKLNEVYIGDLYRIVNNNAEYVCCHPLAKINSSPCSKEYDKRTEKAPRYRNIASLNDKHIYLSAYQTIADGIKYQKDRAENAPDREFYTDEILYGDNDNQNNQYFFTNVKALAPLDKRVVSAKQLVKILCNLNIYFGEAFTDYYQADYKKALR